MQTLLKQATKFIQRLKSPEIFRAFVILLPLPSYESQQESIIIYAGL